MKPIRRRALRLAVRAVAALFRPPPRLVLVPWPGLVLVALLAALLASGSAGAARAQERVLREDQVTQQALIDALAPAAPATATTATSAAATGGEPRSRSFRPALRPLATAAAAIGASGPSATALRAAILVTFVTNSADLTATAKGALDKLAGAMKSERLARASFTIEGHADPRGGEALNLRLSQARADSVRGYLLAQHGLPADRVSAVGKGSSALLNTADPAAPENRRVTIVSQPG